MVMLNEKITTLSWSRIQTYLQCPKKFSLHYLEKRPHERTSSSLVFGSALHTAIEYVNETRLAFDALPSLEEAMREFQRGWETESAGKNIQFGKTESAKSILMQAERMLGAYLSHQSQQSCSQVIAVEHEATFTLSPELPMFVARLDLIELNGDGDLIITDFKSSKSSYSEQKTRESFPQVIAYSLAAMNLLRALGAKRIVPQLVVVTKAKTPKVQILRPKSSQSDVEKLKTLAADIWRAIQSEQWMPREGWQCNSCPFRDTCRGAQPCGAV